MAKRKKKTKNSQQAKPNWLVLGTGLGLVAVFIAVFAWPFGSTAQATFQNVTVQDLAALEGEDHLVLDVREQWEYDEGHVPGVTLIPLGELQARASELPSDKAIYVICRSGNRSVTASNILLEAGFQEILNVQGGTLAWAQAGYPIE